MGHRPRAVTSSTLRPTDSAAIGVAGRWDQLIRYTSLRLGRELGIEVRPALSPKELADPSLRLQQVTNDLATRGVLAGEVVIPNTVGALSIVADLRTTQIRCSVELDAPREGRSQTRSAGSSVRWRRRPTSCALRR